MQRWTRYENRAGGSDLKMTPVLSLMGWMVGCALPSLQDPRWAQAEQDEAEVRADYVENPQYGPVQTSSHWKLTGWDLLYADKIWENEAFVVQWQKVCLVCRRPQVPEGFTKEKHYHTNGLVFLNDSVQDSLDKSQGSLLTQCMGVSCISLVNSPLRFFWASVANFPQSLHVSWIASRGP